MAKHNGRLLLIALGVCGLTMLAGGGVDAQSLTLSANPTKATANSVWNWTAVWTDSEGRWPIGTPDGPVTEGGVDRTQGTLRPGFAGCDDAALDKLNAPTYDGFSAPAGAPSYERYFPTTYASLQPDPAPPIRRQSSEDRRYCRGMDYVDMESVDVPADPPVAPDQLTAGIWRVADGSRAVFIVPSQDPVWLTGVYLDAGRTTSAASNLVAASTINEAYPADKYVILLPNGVPRGYPRVYLCYYRPGRTYVAVPTCAGTDAKGNELAGAPLPLPFTVYTYAAPSATRPRIKINEEILNLNGGLQAAYNRDQMLLSAGSPLLGIYENEDLTGTNLYSYWEPGFSLIYLTTRLPETATEAWVQCTARMPGTPDESLARVAPQNPSIITGVDGVFTAPNFTGTNYYTADTFRTGDQYIELTTPLPAGTQTVYIRYRGQKAAPEEDLVTVIPSDPSGIVSMIGGGVYLTSDLASAPNPADKTNYLVPFERPNDGHPAYAWINLPLGREISGSTLYVQVDTFAVDGVYDNPLDTTKNYFQLNGVRSVYDAKQGIIKLAQPLAQDGAVVWIDYRPLSRTTMTVGRPVLGVVTQFGPTPAGDRAQPAEGTLYHTSNGHNNGRFTLPATSENNQTNLLAIGTYSAVVTYSLADSEAGRTGVVWLGRDIGAPIPMYYIDGNPVSGARYKVSTSAGLNMSNPLQQPSGIRAEDRLPDNNRLIYDPFGHPMWYSPGLKAHGDGSPRGRTVEAHCFYMTPQGPVRVAVTTDVTVHDSRRLLPGEVIDHGGNTTGRDWLTCYPDANWPDNYDVDPLSVEPIEEANPAAPDDGSSSTQFVFRVRYHNKDSLPPLPWMHYCDEWGGPGPSGVVLYLDEKGTGDYKPHYMYPEVPLARDAPFPENLVYIYRVIPHHGIGVWNDPLEYPMHWSNKHYQSLGIGVYHYFFACSDDSLTFDKDGSFPFEHNDMHEYGANLDDSPAMDPIRDRQVSGYPQLNRLAKRRFTSDGVTPYDFTLHVDRPVRVPGLFETGYTFTYPWKASEHPRVTCELGMGTEKPWTDELGVPYDDVKYGEGRFFGTIVPFYRSANPEHPGVRMTGDMARRAETCGATAKTENVFRILYRQVDNKPPIYIRVFINNAYQKSPNDAAHAYTAYTMYPRADQTRPYDYRKGVWYEYKTKLPPGSHTYYFQAYDGEHVVRFPVRPDRYDYDYAGEPGYYNMDWWVPTDSRATDRGKPDYFDNDYFPGPFVNHPCVISDTSVTPGTGREGQQFRYRAKYSDPDGQRPFSAMVHIEVNDRGDVRSFQMSPETPILDPTADNSQLYKDGVYYVLDTATLKDFALEKGVRRYYFEFIDDWGRQHDVNDTVKGETTRFPQGDGNWISGPVISGNYAPTLANGSVESQDGSSNAATLWTYRVTYRDLNNDAPAMIKVFLGLLQPDGRTIIWDEGHAMLPEDPSDRVYSDGAAYYYQTRLGAVDTVDPNQLQPEPKQYFYAFEAYDGTDWATYKSSSVDEVRSNAAGCMILHDLDKIDDTHYRARPLLVQRGTATGPLDLVPDNPGDIVRVLGVYRTEDLAQAPAQADRYNFHRAFAPGDAVIYTSPLPAGTSTVWIKHHKSQTAAVASTTQVTPSNPADITVRLLGVYLDSNLLGKNYYDPAAANPAYAPGSSTISLTSSLPDGVTAAYLLYETIQQGAAATAQSVTPSSAASILKVTGVYLNSAATGTSYHTAFEPGDSVVKLTDSVTVGSKLWIQYEAISPIVGPLPVGLPEPAGIIPDARVFQDYASNPVPMKLDGQKNGWISPYDPNDRSVIWMRGTAQFEGKPSLKYVAPDNSASIASIEGVYLTRNLDKDPTPQDPSDDWKYQNYYDPEAVDPPVKQIGSVTWSGGTATVTPSDPERITAILGVYTTADLSGKNYYRGSGLNWQEGTVTDLNHVLPTKPQDIVSVQGVYLGMDQSQLNYYSAAANPYRRPDLTREAAPDSELITLSRELPTTPSTYNRVWIRYYSPGGLDQSGRVPISEALPAGTSTVYIHYRASSYNCGDKSIRLTTDLPFETMEGKVEVPMQVTPADASIIGEVLGVYRSQAESVDPANNLYAANENPFRQGDSYIRLKNNLVNPPAVGATGLYITYIPKNRTVYVKYSDIRFTYQIRGLATQVLSSYSSPLLPYSLFTTTGTTHFEPNGGSSASIKGNAQSGSVDDFSHVTDAYGRLIDRELVSGGLVGVWLSSARQGTNYFNPSQVSRHENQAGWIRLYDEVPYGTEHLWANYYQYGNYHIDRWNRLIVFRPTGESYGRLQASYFFGTKMPSALGPNTAPELYGGSISRLKGSRNDQYVYSVTYKDLDGPNGQAPVYVRCYIDGVPYDMKPIVQGTPAFREGAVYTFTPPDGLTGGSHKFHFEASDGASIAWFDANGSHQSLLGAQVPTSAVVDIDGPWVNNPPELLDGLASPNPATGGINPWDSIDYTVIYQDADNDEPYFYDPVRDVNDYDANRNGIMDGPEYSGSPRLWVDSGAVDQYFTGTVSALEDDLMVLGKKRTIVASGTPGWIPDQFAGALMQVTNGAITGRVYLIQSNTTNKLVIATDDLAADGVIAGGVNATTFRINGLLMSKLDPTQQDFTRGVKYKITVPKLAVGSHRFHFTARSREYKPQWLIGRLTAQERVPYSGEVKFPTAGDASGPVVVSTPPAGNSQPVISLTPESQRDDPKDPLFVGPMAQMAVATAADRVEALYPTLFAQIRMVRGVFLNANDLDLATISSPTEFAKTYYNPKTATTQFAPGNTRITLTSEVSPVAAGTQLVQFGNVDASSLLKVVPDAGNIIGSVIGVYSTSDPTLAGTNYYLSADGQPTGSFDGSNINLGQPLPSGTKRVYVKYAYSPMTPGAQWPIPVYVKYFKLTTNRTFKSSDMVAFLAGYRDADNDPPNYHDSVQGYIKLVFNTSGQGRQMQLLNPPGAGEKLDYTRDLPFATEPMTLPEGQHRYHIEASDGYYAVRFPAGALGDPAANDYTLTVNYRPVITAAKVEPAIGQTATTFTFTATYKDQDGTASKPPRVSVRITKLDGAPWEEVRDMNVTSTNPNYAAGVDYVYFRRDLAAGNYKVVFEATDGDGEDAVPYPGPGQAPMLFSVRDSNEAPEIVSVGVAPGAGGMNRLFNYTARYRDNDGDAPIGKTDGQKDTMTLVIDPGTASEQRLKLTKAPGEPTTPDYRAGVNYQTTQAVSGRKLGSGQHSYTVEASDGTADTGLLMTGSVVTSDALLKTVAPSTPADIGTVVGVYRERDIRNKTNYFVAADGVTKGQFVNGQIKLARSLPSGTTTVYIHYAARGPVLLIPYFTDFRAVDAASNPPETAAGITESVVGQEVLFVGNLKFPYNTLTNPPTQINDITVQISKPDGTAVSLSGSITSYQDETETLADGTTRKIASVGRIKVSYPQGADPSLVTGKSFTLTASGQWTISVSWPGDSSWDPASTQGREVRISVGGLMRTVAVTDPTMPDTSTPLVDMITVPKILGSPDVGRVFGYDSALEMQIVRWDPSSRTYFRYGAAGAVPGSLAGSGNMDQAEAVVSCGDHQPEHAGSGVCWPSAIPETPLTSQMKYRVLRAFVKDYTKDAVTGQAEPCGIALRTGWNQFGSIFFNWKRSASGAEISPRVDVGIPISELKVRYLNETKSLADAAAAGWIRGYAWRWDAVQRQYVLVSPTAAGAERVVKAWSGYWIRAFVDCELVVPSTTRYNGETLGAAPRALKSPADGGPAVAGEELDTPPPAPE
jgi:hypothetical protein